MLARALYTYDVHIRLIHTAVSFASFSHSTRGVALEYGYSKGLPYRNDVRSPAVCMSTLSKILHDKDALSFRKGFDIGSIVAAAYVYWEQRDLRTARAI